MKGVLELNWKILIAVITAVVLFTIVFLVAIGMLNTCTISTGGKEVCLLLISKLQIFGFGAEQIQMCEVFKEC